MTKLIGLNATNKAVVIETQQMLAELQYTVKVDGVFGAKTERAVKSFQRSNKIKEDGIVGPDTMWLLKVAVGRYKPEAVIVPPPAGIVQAVIAVATSQLGVRESPKNSNRGKEVEQYLASIGLGGGYAWCMAFVYWCVNEAARQTGGSNPLYKTGGVLMQWRQRQPLAVKTPAPGDVFIMDFGKGTGHCGFVTQVDGSGFHTIEGNTNASGSREGDGVYARKRTISSCKGFLRLTK